ncbi:complex III assembly factor LYRM7 [Salvelinus alpinus]|uniref:complex III assembly factor LYRM7 n=1 Tax=Salvelinus alpinus TaxID=8036 RepID=UPI0039FDA5CE
MLHRACIAYCLLSSRFNCKVKMASRLKVLRVFKALHRTRMELFKEDTRALTAARRKINEEFRKNKNETSEENINQMIKMAAGVEVFLRQDVVQAEHVAEDRIQLRPRESLLLENVPYCDTPRKRSSSNNAPKQSCKDAPITRCE